DRRAWSGAALFDVQNATGRALARPMKWRADEPGRGLCEVPGGLRIGDHEGTEIGIGVPESLDAQPEESPGEGDQVVAAVPADEGVPPPAEIIDHASPGELRRSG